MSYIKLRKGRRFDAGNMGGNLTAIFEKYKKVFVYHTLADQADSPPWRDLTKVGCRFITWFTLRDRLAEAYIYPNKKIKLMVHMLVGDKQIIWRDHYMELKKKLMKNKKLSKTMLTHQLAGKLGDIKGPLDIW